MLIRLHVVVDQEDESLETHIKEKLHAIHPKLSFSPSRPQPSLAHCLEFFATARMESDEIDAFLKALNNDWDGTRDDCEAYGFNTVMFDSHVYYLQFQIQ